jgi:hypothetical protein
MGRRTLPALFFQNQNHQHVKPEFIWEKEAILSFLDQADRLLEITINGDNPEEVVDRMAHIIRRSMSAMSGLSSRIIAGHLLLPLCLEIISILALVSGAALSAGQNGRTRLLRIA